MSNKTLKIKNICMSNDLPIVLIAGPCQIESLNHSRKIAEILCKLGQKLNFELIFAMNIYVQYKPLFDFSILFGFLYSCNKDQVPFEDDYTWFELWCGLK